MVRFKKNTRITKNWSICGGVGIAGLVYPMPTYAHTARLMPSTSLDLFVFTLAGALVCHCLTAGWNSLIHCRRYNPRQRWIVWRAHVSTWLLRLTLLTLPMKSSSLQVQCVAGFRTHSHSSDSISSRSSLGKSRITPVLEWLLVQSVFNNPKLLQTQN